ncbi:MAG: GcrA cell cycle regulator, partial [Rhodobacterales bacterium]|nr:GcrA cell cycle regulator [Rhodobacterales bacterium]
AMPARRAIVPAGQPLPPQPSVGEISPEALASVREVEKRARRLTLMELTERTCKWPIGDPATPDFWFCGLPAHPGKPYCEAHVGVAFQPMSARRDRRR